MLLLLKNIYFSLKEHRSSADERLNVSDILPLVKVSRKQCFKFFSRYARTIIWSMSCVFPPTHLTNGFAFIVL